MTLTFELQYHNGDFEDLTTKINVGSNQTANRKGTNASPLDCIYVNNINT